MNSDCQPGKIHSAIIAIMRAVGPIAKDSQNTQQNYKFRGVDAVYNACHPHFAEHGVYSTSEVLDAIHNTDKSAKGQTIYNAILRMRFTYHADDGSCVSTEVVGHGQDYGGDKASNKAMSVADKYALLQLLKIPVAMVDPDRHENPEPRANAPKQQPRAKRVEKEWLIDMANKWYQDNPGKTVDDWRVFVGKYVSREFNLRKPDEWSMDEYEAVRAAVNEGMKDDVPF